MRRATILFLALGVVACSGAGDGTTTTGPGTTSSSSLPGESTTSTTTPSIGCPQEAEFIGTGQINRITQPTSDSRTLGLVSRQVDGTCERFGFDFDTAEDAPATTPPSVNARFLDGERIIRISLGIDRTVITDQLIETRLVDRLFVVRALDGEMFIDLHLRERSNARVTVSNSPARLTLELTPGTGDLGPAAAIADHTVVLVPPNESTLDPDFDVVGYSRAPEANVLIVATRSNEVILNQSVTAADWLDTWGEFESEVSLTSGQVTLFVGEESAEDGSLLGVTLNLTIR